MRWDIDADSTYIHDVNYRQRLPRVMLSGIYPALSIDLHWLLDRDADREGVEAAGVGRDGSVPRREGEVRCRLGARGRVTRCWAVRRPWPFVGECHRPIAQHCGITGEGISDPEYKIHWILSSAVTAHVSYDPPLGTQT